MPAQFKAASSMSIALFPDQAHINFRSVVTISAIDASVLMSK